MLMAGVPLPSRFRNERQKVRIAYVSNARCKPKGKKEKKDFGIGGIDSCSKK
jgi:hypothetical protein